MLEFRATPNADSGVFIREPQLQCRDYLLAGPYKELQKYKPGEWNEIVVTVTDGIAHSTCNGELLEKAMKVPDSGPIGLEGDRGQVEYRRIRNQENAVVAKYSVFGIRSHNQATIAERNRVPGTGRAQNRTTNIPLDTA